jgi:prolyl-tRNA synthetase
LQVVIVPILGKALGDQAAVAAACEAARQSLEAAGVRAKVDGRDHVRPGAKFFEWERKGVPLRLEVA